jgi:hypothetical protein
VDLIKKAASCLAKLILAGTAVTTSHAPAEFPSDITTLPRITASGNRRKSIGVGSLPVAPWKEGFIWTGGEHLPVAAIAVNAAKIVQIAMILIGLSVAISKTAS